MEGVAAAGVGERRRRQPQRRAVDCERGTVRELCRQLEERGCAEPAQRTNATNARSERVGHAAVGAARVVTSEHGREVAL
eukprot:4409799-Prymnesium_polylepis.1